jgi:hypothetical protein
LRGCSIVTDEENLDCDDAGVSCLTQTSNEAPRERDMDLKLDQSLRHEDGRCPLWHCADTKKLREHLTQCKDLKCIFPHCENTRHMLAHYHKCKVVQCLLSVPVRAEIRQSKEKENGTKRIHSGRLAERQGYG